MNSITSVSKRGYRSKTNAAVLAFSLTALVSAALLVPTLSQAACEKECKQLERLERDFDNARAGLRKSRRGSQAYDNFLNAMRIASKKAQDVGKLPAFLACKRIAQNAGVPVCP